MATDLLSAQSKERKRKSGKKSNGSKKSSSAKKSSSSRSTTSGKSSKSNRHSREVPVEVGQIFPPLAKGQTTPDSSPRLHSPFTGTSRSNPSLNLEAHKNLLGHRKDSDDEDTQFDSCPGSDGDCDFIIRSSSPSPPASPSWARLGGRRSPSPAPPAQTSSHVAVEDNIYKPKPSTDGMNPFKRQMHDLLERIMDKYASSDDECSEEDDDLLAALDDLKSVLLLVKDHQLLDNNQRLFLRNFSNQLAHLASQYSS